MTPAREHLIESLAPYDAELQRVVDFWLTRSLDQDHGGYLTQIDRQGRVFGSDKNVWVQARQCWTFAALYNQVEQKPEWLEASRLGRNFLLRHAYAGDGRWYYLLSREGEVINPNVSLATDFFVLMALAEFAVASQDNQDHELIEITYNQLERRFGPPAVNQWHHFSLDPDRLWLAPHMLAIGVAPVIRPVLGEERVNPLASRALETITRVFTRDQERAVFEVLHLDGRPDSSDIGQRLNPGHAIEAAWFCAEEATATGDHEALRRSIDMCRWSYQRGYDEQYGGLFAFVGLDGGRPPGSEYINAWGDRWDDKLWWVQSESLYGIALAAALANDTDLCEAFDKLHDFVQQFQVDHEHGEWYERVHRYGEPLCPLKGSWIKCMFHLTRNLYKLVNLRKYLVTDDLSALI